MEMPASFPQVLHVGTRERKLSIVPADDISGKLGQTSTDFEVRCRKSASIIGIDHS